MRFRRSSLIALLLLLAFSGCQHALPVQSQPNKDVRPSLSDLHPSELQRIPPVENVSLASYEEAEEMPAPDKQPQIEEAGPLRLADLEQIATENNPVLSAAVAKLDATEGQQVQAGLYPNPVLGYHATEIGNLDTAGQQGAFASQKFITGGKLGLDQAIAEKKNIEAYVFLAAQYQRVKSDVRIRFYEALVAQRRVELARELTEIGKNLVEASDNLLQGRVGTENDLLQAQIRAEESEIELENAMNEQQEAWNRLAAILGEPDLEMSPLAGDLDAALPDYTWDDCCELVLQDNPELDAARIRVDRASIVIRRAEKEPIPDIDVMVSVRHHNVSQYDVANVQVGMPIPVFNRNQGNIRSADAEWIFANREVERIELDLRDRLAVAYRQFTNAKQQVEKYRDRILPRASKSLALVTNGYEKGQVEYLTLLTAQQTYIQANLSYLDSLRELRTAASIIEGQLLTGSLSGR